MVSKWWTIEFFQIWELIDCKGGHVNRNNLYKALALVAYAQQGKTVSEKLFQNFSGQGKQQLISIK